MAINKSIRIASIVIVSVTALLIAFALGILIYAKINIDFLKKHSLKEK